MTVSVAVELWDMTVLVRWLSCGVREAREVVEVDMMTLWWMSCRCRGKLKR